MNYVPFDYIIYYALECLLKYEISDEVHINTLLKYKNELLNTIVTLYEQDDIWFGMDDFDLLDDNLCFEKLDDLKELKSFIRKNSDLFFVKNNILKIRDEVTIEQLEARRNSAQYDSKTVISWIVGLGDNVELLDILGNSKLKSKLLSYLENEIKIQNEYDTLDSKGEICTNNFQIDFLQFFSLAFVNKLANADNKDFEVFLRLLSKIYKQNKNVTIKLLDVEEVEDSIFIDEFHYAKTRDIFQSDVFLNAIFSDNPLSYNKIDYRIAKIAYAKEEDDYTHVFNPLEDEYDEDEMYFEDCDEFDEEELDECDEEYYDEEISEYDPQKIEQAEFSFFLKYIDKINEYNSKYDYNEELGKVKNRLLYILDNSFYKLYIKENFDKALEMTNQAELDYEEDIWDYSRCAKAFFADVFESKRQNEFTVRKLLFISTYYELTKSEEISEELLFYKEHPFYEEYSKMILGESKDKRKIK